MDNIAIHTEEIQLNQLLKLANVLSSGGQIKFLLEEGRIFLNGAPVVEKRKKICVGDVVEVREIGAWKVVKMQGE